MHLFIVIFREPVAEDWQKAAGAVLSDDDVFVVSKYELIVCLHTSEPSFLAQAFGLYGKGPDPSLGAVFRLQGSYSGFYHVALWDWLQEKLKDVPVSV